MINIFTVGELKEIIKDLPDDALVLYSDPYSEFSYDVKGVDKGFTKISHVTYSGDRFYYTWGEYSFKNFLEDNPEDIESLKQEHKPSLLLYIEY